MDPVDDFGDSRCFPDAGSSLNTEYLPISVCLPLCLLSALLGCQRTGLSLPGFRGLLGVLFFWMHEMQNELFWMHETQNEIFVCSLFLVVLSRHVEMPLICVY